MKILTILVPVYNTELYIRRCLDSILTKETYQDIEVLIVNDGSTDHSVDIIKEYCEKYPDTITFVNKKNGGHGSTINVGIQRAKGKYFRVLDSDDWFDTIAFVSYLKKLKKCNEDLILTPYYEEYVYNGTRKWFGYLDYEMDQQYLFNDIDVHSPNYFAFVMASSTYKTSVLQESGFKLFEKTFYVDMQFIVFSILRVHTLRFLSENVYRYFIGRPTQSMSQENLIKHLPDHRKVLYSLIEYYIQNKNQMNKSQKEYLKNIVGTMIYTHVNIVCVQLKNRKQAYNQIKELDCYIRGKDLELYQEFQKIPYIHFSKKMAYLNVRYFYKFFSVLIEVGRNIKRRLIK